VTPVRTSLEKVDSHIYELEKARAGAYASLHEQVRNMAPLGVQIPELEPVEKAVRELQ
jgi:hypothetical protein